MTKEVLKGFYSVIKAREDRVRFAFLTGVTKFAKISVFSGLNNLIKDEGFDVSRMDDLMATEASFSTFDVEKLRVLPILVQSGYLTLKDSLPERHSYYLGFPNREVRSAFLDNLLDDFTPVKGVSDDSPLLQLEEALKAHDLELFFENLEILFAKKPSDEAFSYDIHLPYEKYWQSLFFMIFALMGYYIEVEYRTSRGRIDAILNLEERVFIFEFKVTSEKRPDADKLLAEAREQIVSTDYARRFLGRSKPVSLLAAVFDCLREKAVVRWEDLDAEL